MDKEDIYHKPNQNCSRWGRTLCSVLDEMRDCYKTRNFSYLEGLIEEAQTYANRMESKLNDVSEYETLKERYKKLKKRHDELEPKTQE